MGSSPFIKLTIDEMMVKLNTLASQKEMVKIWIRGEESQLYRCSNFSILKCTEHRDALLSLFSEGEEMDSEFIGKSALLTFQLKGTDYFSGAEVTFDDIHKQLVLKLDDDFYRSEKRATERLLTYPHHQVYVYFKIRTEKNESNIIELKKDDDKYHIDYKKQQKKELNEKLREKISDVEDLFGFRVLDISKGGIAFLAGESERGFFSHKSKYSFYILFEGDMFIIKASDLVYKVDYIGGKGFEAKYKIGLRFAPNRKLTDYVDTVLREEIGSDSIKREFEDFSDE